MHFGSLQTIFFLLLPYCEKIYDIIFLKLDHYWGTFYVNQNGLERPKIDFKNILSLKIVKTNSYQPPPPQYEKFHIFFIFEGFHYSDCLL